MAKKSGKILKTKKFLKVDNQDFAKPESFKQEIKKIRIKVVGVGGGGGNIVSEIASKIQPCSYPISFAALNTDLQALRNLDRKVIPFPFGKNFTRGFGTGMNQELAREAVLNEKEKIKKLFEGQDLSIIISSLGGGTGSGISSIIGKIAKSCGTITFGVFTIPFKFEGKKKQEIAWNTLEKLKQTFNAVVVISNDRIFQIIEKNTPLEKALSVVNKSLAESLGGLIETIYFPGLINIDFADLKTILHGQARFAYLNTVDVEGNNCALEAVKSVLNCPLYPYTVKGARRVLFNISGGKELSLSDVSQISRTIFEELHPQARIIFGLHQNKKYQNKIKIMVLATGCTFKFPSLTSSKPDFFLGKNKKVKKNTEKKRCSEKVASKEKTKKMTEKTKRIKLRSKAPKTKTKIKVEEKKLEPSNLELPKLEEKLSEFLLSGGGHKEEEIKNLETAPVSVSENAKIRKNALQLKKEMEEMEKEFLEREQFWETPAFLRKKFKIQ